MVEKNIPSSISEDQTNKNSNPDFPLKITIIIVLKKWKLKFQRFERLFPCPKKFGETENQLLTPCLANSV